MDLVKSIYTNDNNKLLSLVPFENFLYLAVKNGL